MSIAGPPSVTTQQSRELTLRAVAALPSCNSTVLGNDLPVEPAIVNFVWSLEVNDNVGVRMELDVATKHTSALHVPPMSLPTAIPVTLRVTACTSVTKCATATVTVTAEPDPFEVNIIGGTIRTVGNVNGFVLEAAVSTSTSGGLGSATDGYIEAGVMMNWICRDGAGNVVLTSLGRRWQIEAGENTLLSWLMLILPLAPYMQVN